MLGKRMIVLYGILLVVIITIIISLVLINNKKINTNSSQVAIPTPVSIETKQQGQAIEPGKSNFQDVKRIYGNPIKTLSQNGLTENDYNIPNTWRVNKVYLKNNIVQYMRQEQTSDNSDYADFLKQTNIKPDAELYDQQGYGGPLKWYIFSEKGIAFYTNAQTGYSYATITFIPMPYADFLKNVAPVFNIQQSEPEEVNVDSNNPQNQ